MENKVSVIIPNYNHAAYLHQRIDTVLNQTLKPFEIIILDDASTDNSVEIIEAVVSDDPRIKFIKNAINSGSTFAQWNKGVAMAEGDLIWIAESDDVAEPTFLEKLLPFFESDNKIAMAYCQSNSINAAGEITGTWETFTNDLDSELFNKEFIMDGATYIERFLIHRNTIPNASAVIFKKYLYIDSGGGTVPLKNVGDWLIWLKILSCGKIAFTSMLLNHFRAHGESVIAKSIKNEDKTVFKDWYGLEMRSSLSKFLNTKKINISTETKKINAYYMAIDKGNMGLFKLKNGHFLNGWKLIFQASFFSKFQSGFIKKALFIKQTKSVK